MPFDFVFITNSVLFHTKDSFNVHTTPEAAYSTTKTEPNSAL